MPVALALHVPGARPMHIGYVPSRADAQTFARALERRGARVQATDAGDLLPTYVNTESVYRYLDQTDASVNALGLSIGGNAGKFDQAWINRWTDFLVRWKQFFSKERAETHYLDARSVMGDTDDFVRELAGYDRDARAKGAAPTTPPVVPPKSDDGPGFLSGLGTGAVLAAGLVTLLLLSR